MAQERGLDSSRIFVKIPATKAGMDAIEELARLGINVNVTLVFSISQALEAISAYERGGFGGKIYISPFIGRWDNYIERNGIEAQDRNGNPVAGLNFAKLMHKEFKKLLSKKFFPSEPKLIMASFRSLNHIRELIGADILTIPPNILFLPELREIETKARIDKIYPEELIEPLYQNEWYRKSIVEEGLSEEEFDLHPLVAEGNQKFITSYLELLGLIAEMLNP
jgi:transaldolase